MKINSVYVSCSSNRTPGSCDWDTTTNLICYCSSNAVLVASAKAPAEVKHVLTGHEQRVNSVKWIRTQPFAGQWTQEFSEIVSASTDKTCRIWRNRNKHKFECVATLSGHSETVTVIDGLYTRSSTDQNKSHDWRTLIAGASVDSTVKIWERKTLEGDFCCIQSLSFGSGFCLAVVWIVTPDSNGKPIVSGFASKSIEIVPLLACGGDDQKIHIFVEVQNKFVKVQSLAGHEDWVRGLDFAVCDNKELLLSSCGQDSYIRIWRFSPRDPSELHITSQVSLLSIEEDIKLRENTFTFRANGEEFCYAVSLESVLQGHENWVYSVRWQPPVIQGESQHQPLCLLSASMDKTMILWKPEPQSGLWIEQAKVGEVGGNSLGFYGGVFSPDGQSIMSHGYHGAFELRTLNMETNVWEPQVTCGGHFDGVQDIAWQPQTGHFLLSLSTDQTTRCHGYWKSEDQKESSWHEVGRPQIHGYDMQCIVMIDRYAFASGADEKVVRVFQAPKNFVETFAKISSLDLSKDVETTCQATGASVPSLGLSNKAVFENEVKAISGGHEVESHPNEQYPEVYFTPVNITQPPPEVDLLQNTLWPEVQKLYGHGYEIFSLDAHPDGSLLASASKAAKPDHAGIILWDTKTWRQVCKLHGHSLTVTQICFSHSGHYLLSVSRDRTWALFERTDSTSQPAGDPYTRVAYSDKKSSLHSRIIWGCSWSHDDKYFITVSRDKKAIIWAVTTDIESSSPLGCVKCYSSPLVLPDSITAVDWAPVYLPDKTYLLSFGLDNGCVLLYTWTDKEGNSPQAWSHTATLMQSDAHHLTVKRVKFRPRPGRVEDSAKERNSDILQLASCGLDHCVRVYNIDTSESNNT